MSVQVPVTYEGEQDAKSMYPSNILFKHGDNSLIPELSQEYLFGMSKISKMGKNTGKSYSSIKKAKEDDLKATDVFKLNGKKMTIGQHEINKVLPKKYQDYQREFKYSELNDLLEKIAKNEDSDAFKKIINHYKDVGALYQYKYGGTVSIDDMVFDRSYRDDLIKKHKPRIEKLKDPKKRAKGYMKLVDEIEKAQNKALDGKNRMLELVEGGAVSKSKAGNIRQVLSAPGVMSGTDGEPIPEPVLKSYSEGLDTFDYFNTMPGVRKGVVDKSVNTQESGALNKQLLAVNRRLVIVEEDCGTTDGRTYSIDNKNIMDRAALNTVPGVVRRNEIIDGDVIQKAKRKEVKELDVRTPLQCESSNGICKHCYGLMPGGSLPDIGENVGILESQALSERSCNHEDSLMIIKEKQNIYPITLKQLWNKYKDIKVEKGKLDSEDPEITHVKDLSNINIEVYDGENFTSLNKIGRHKPSDKMVVVKTYDGGFTVCQNNHPLPV